MFNPDHCCSWCTPSCVCQYMQCVEDVSVCCQRYGTHIVQYPVFCSLQCCYMYQVLTVSAQNTNNTHLRQGHCSAWCIPMFVCWYIPCMHGPTITATLSSFYPYICVVLLVLTLFHTTLLVLGVCQYTFISSYIASRDNWCTVEGDGGWRVGEVRAGTTSPMPDHKGFKLQ